MNREIFNEHWDSGVIGSEKPVSPVDESPSPSVLARQRIHTTKYGTLTGLEWQSYLTESRKSTVQHSDGFLSLSHVNLPPAYTCRHCGFNGLFKATLCARCHTRLHTHKRKDSQHGKL